MARFAWCALLLFVAAANDVSIRNSDGAFQVIGWKAGAEPVGGWSSIFTVSTGGGDLPPMLGTYRVDKGILTFQPRWPIAPGIPVHASFHAPGVPPVEAEFANSAHLPRSAQATRVEHVYPSTGELPENALRLYIYFSAPMGRGDAWQHIHLLDSDGKKLELVFLEIDQELWDSANTRLTVLFDPGRIKRGLLPLRESGPNLSEGRTYTLVIDHDWRDSDGQPLASDFKKPFRVVPADRAPIDPAKWRVAAPHSGSLEPLVVSFSKPLDYALALRTLSVAGVNGVSALAREETEWRFTPASPWKAGSFQLLIDSALEDLAGNRIGRSFDVDTFTQITKTNRTHVMSVPFRVAP